MVERLTQIDTVTHMRTSRLGDLLFGATRSQRLCPLALRQSLRWEGGQFFSQTARKIMRERFGVSIGDYSHGSCFDLTAFGPGTTIGRYVSLAQRIRAYAANHPVDWLSMHGFFFCAELGYVQSSPIKEGSYTPSLNLPLTPLVIEHDAWLGDGVIITPRCQRIGLGAVVGAGSVVTKDVPDFAIVVGCPARILKVKDA